MYFIDEINRANISAVFGELITLIEDDKRIGGTHELWVDLPISNTPFGVPSNLFIVGTMNTADKSIALVDIALRRRFEFISHYPTEIQLERLVTEGLLEKSTKDLLMVLNKNIFEERKSADYLIGHSFFLNLKGDQNIENVLRKKIIPLLFEYFSGNITKIASAFKGTVWKVEYQTNTFEWSISKIQ